MTPLLLPMLGLTALPTAPTFLTHMNPDPDAVDLMCAGGTAAGQTRDGGDGDEGGEDSGEEGTPWVPSTGRKRRRSAAAVGTGPRVRASLDARMTRFRPSSFQDAVFCRADTHPKVSPSTLCCIAKIYVFISFR